MERCCRGRTGDQERVQRQRPRTTASAPHKLTARYFSGYGLPLRRLTLLFDSLYTQVTAQGVAAEHLS